VIVVGLHNWPNLEKVTTDICVVNLFYELIAECIWKHIERLSGCERKHV